MSETKKDHGGHRKRMLQKLREDIVSEHDYLEILLFHAIPRRNTSDIAHRLIARFGSMMNVLKASFDELKSVEGVGDSVAGYLLCIGQFYNRRFRSEQIEYQGKYDPDRFVEFVSDHFERKDIEYLDIYFLDVAGYIFHHFLVEGEASSVYFEKEEFTKLLADFNPKGVLLVHNHPTQEAKPSEADEKMTKAFQLYCSNHGLIFFDHIIQSQVSLYSYCLSGKMKRFRYAFTTDNVMRVMEEQGDYL